MATAEETLKGKIENTTYIVGKIVEQVITKSNNYLYTVKLPAPDEFSHPQTVPVLATEKIGVVGDTIKQKCIINGYARKYNRNDGSQGTNFDVTFLAD